MLLAETSGGERWKSTANALLSSGEKGLFFAMDFGCPGRNETDIFRDGHRRSRSARWEDRFHSGLNPVIYRRCRKPCNNAFTDERRRRRRWRPCMATLLFSPPSFYVPLHDFYFLSVLSRSLSLFVAFSFLPAFLGSL